MSPARGVGGWVLHPALRTLLFSIAVPGTVTAVVPYAYFRAGLHRPDGASWAGLLPLAFGVALYAWCASEFSWRGRGTPNPLDPPRVLVVQGPYRVVRNPMYVAVLLVLVGEALLLTSPSIAVYAAAVACAFALFVLVIEEPILRRKFGASYADYVRRVPRWLPRPRRRP
jgi:protein-S-isoprenylcysteine O-methyltransferase Ste14